MLFRSKRPHRYVSPQPQRATKRFLGTLLPLPPLPPLTRRQRVSFQSRAPTDSLTRRTRCRSGPFDTLLFTGAVAATAPHTPVSRIPYSVFASEKPALVVKNTIRPTQTDNHLATPLERSETCCFRAVRRQHPLSPRTKTSLAPPAQSCSGAIGLLRGTQTQVHTQRLGNTKGSRHKTILPRKTRAVRFATDHTREGTTRPDYVVTSTRTPVGGMRGLSFMLE